MVVWAAGPRRCMLWTVSGLAELRVFDGPELIHSERMTPGAALAQARELRSLYGLSDRRAVP
jgi:hypothetical protein